MSKLLLAILLVFSTCAVVAHGILAYQYNVTQSLVAEEEGKDDKPAGKDAKDYGKEKITFSSSLYNLFISNKLHQSLLNSLIKCSKGFFDKPYNPPEVI